MFGCIPTTMIGANGRRQSRWRRERDFLFRVDVGDGRGRGGLTARRASFLRCRNPQRAYCAHFNL